MPLSGKNYQAISRLLKNLFDDDTPLEEADDTIVDNFIADLKKDDSNFDEDKFGEACDK